MGGEGRGARRVAGGLSRRGFLRMSAAALATPAWAGCLEGPTEVEIPDGDARLLARPGAPSQSATPGESPLGLTVFERDGLMYVPASYDPAVPAPLLVALHGSTGSSRNWSGFYPACEARGMVMLAVDSRDYTWDRVSGTFGPDVTFIDAALRHTFERVAVDPERIALVGFSDGASYALSLGPSNGDLFPQIVAFSPGFAAPHPDAVGSPRIWISHGRSDMILFEARTRSDIVPALQNAGYDVQYHDFDGGHEIPPEIGGAALDWFLTP